MLTSVQYFSRNDLWTESSREIRLILEVNIGQTHRSNKNKFENAFQRDLSQSKCYGSSGKAAFSTWKLLQLLVLLLTALLKLSVIFKKLYWDIESKRSNKRVTNTSCPVLWKTKSKEVSFDWVHSALFEKWLLSVSIKTVGSSREATSFAMDLQTSVTITQHFKN